MTTSSLFVRTARQSMHLPWALARRTLGLLYNALTVAFWPLSFWRMARAQEKQAESQKAIVLQLHNIYGSLEDIPFRLGDRK